MSFLCSRDFGCYRCIPYGIGKRSGDQHCGKSFNSVFMFRAGFGGAPLVSVSTAQVRPLLGTSPRTNGSQHDSEERDQIKAE